jgi:hypothetical protein
MGSGGGGTCTGKDVIDALNYAFGDVQSTVYTTAQAKNTFAGVTTVAQLKAAYWSLADKTSNPNGIQNGMTINQKTCAGWSGHLDNMNDDQATTIATTRDTALNVGLPIITGIHARRRNTDSNIYICAGSTATSPVSPALIISPYDIIT